MTIIEDADYFIRVVPLPPGIRGMIKPNPDGTFSIYVNSRNLFAQDLKAKKHEIDHILNDDFYNGRPIEEIEAII